MKITAEQCVVIALTIPLVFTAGVLERAVLRQALRLPFNFVVGVASMLGLAGEIYAFTGVDLGLTGYAADIAFFAFVAAVALLAMELWVRAFWAPRPHGPRAEPVLDLDGVEMDPSDRVDSTLQISP